MAGIQISISLSLRLSEPIGKRRMQLTFETHSWSEDNDRGLATGWLPGRLSDRGKVLAAELGGRRRDAAVVFVSDLRRAMETAEIAFAHAGVPVLADWRLRECNYGRLNGMAAAQLHANRRAHLDQPYPEGESWRVARSRADHRACGDAVGARQPAWRPTVGGADR
jgi:2,3-bisphosphoglycerate-dependent phosphoglycerate mutase